MNTRLLLRSRALPLVALLLSLSFGTRAQDAPADEPSPTPEASEGERRSSGSRDDVDSRDGTSSRRRRGSGSRDDVGGERRGGDRTDVATAPDEEIPTPEEGVGSAVQAQLPTGESPTSMSPQAIQLPTGEGSIQGMGESFAPVLSSGTATFSVPIAVPAGRAGVQPSLGLSYSSTGGNGVVGIGWNIGVPFIARQTDRGTPRFDDRESWHRGEDRFIYNGGQELVPVTSSTMAMVDAAGHYGAAPPSVPAELSGWQQYRAKVEGGFLRFFRSPDSTRWVVQSLDGTRFEFGLLPTTVGRPAGFDPRYGVQSENADGTGRIHTWLLTRMSDAHGSTVYYQYFADQGARYLADIYYLSPASACAPSGASIAAIRDCTAPLSDYGVRIRFAYEPRPDAFTSYTSGWAVRQGLRLRTITATSAEENVGTRYLVRRYWLTYDTQRFHSMLTQVQVEGRTEVANGFVGQPVFSRTVEGAPPAAPVGRTLPAMRFEYTTMPGAGPQAPGFGGIDATVHMVASSPPVSLDAPLVDLFDVNGDGLQDVLVTDGARYRTPDGRPGVGVYWNGFLGALAQPAAGATFSTPQVLPLEAGATTILSYSNPNLLGMDVDGDGRGDFLHLPPTLGHGWITPARLHPTPAASPRQQDWAFVHTPRPVDASTDPSINLARDGTFFRVMDVNNDHLVDIVRTTGTEMQTWLNLGWVPGGEGRFGQATPTESGWQLSSQPIRTCLLHDGQPLDFGNGEVRLGDMNGDGLTDIVRMRNNRITYWPGRGGALWGEGSRTCTSGFGASRHIEMSAPPQPLNAELAGVYLQDVDGDGADDVVQVRYRQLDVWFNRAGREFTARITVDSPYAPDFAPNLRFVDIDGSGTTDLLYGRAGQWQYLDLLGGERPRLLAKVHNGLGATTSLEYGSSTEDYLRDLAAASQCTGASCERFTWDGVRDNGCDGVVDRYAGECVYRSGGSPVISRVVRRVQTTDNFAALGVASQVSTQEFAYHDGYYEGIEQEFRGFGAADAHVLGDATVGGLWTRTYFHQGRRPNDIATDRLQENPEEALKGSTYLSEVFDEGGRYLSSAHSSYTVRRLATGLDDRPISFAFGHQTDSFTYDTTSYSAYGAAVDLPAQRWETHGETAPPRTETRPVRIRATRFVWTRSTSDAVDNLGQVHQSTAHGRLHDEDDAPSTAPIAYAEGIVSFQTSAFIAAHESGWMLRPTHSYVQDAAGGPRLGETTVTYGARGDALRSVQVVQAATPLEFGGDADAPGYTYGTQTLEASTSFDLFGNATASCAGADLASDADGLSCLRYARVTYDAAYFQLPVVEQIATGVTTQGGETSLVTLPTEATYERGLGLLLTATDPNDAVTRAYYDGLGRTLAVDTPNGACATTGAPEQTLTYTLLPGGKPVSFVETTTDARAAPDCATALVTRARAYVDGLGRSRAGLTFAADEAPNRVIVSGLSVLDARGQARVAYDPEARTIAGEPAVEAMLVPGAGVPFVQAVFDPFGRATEAVAQDGSVARTEHHASSVYGFDPNDDPTQNRHAPQHWNTPSISRVDGHGRAIEQVQLLRQPGETSGSVRYLHLRSEYRADGKVLRVIRAETSSPARWQSTSVVDGHQVERTFTYDTAGRRVTTTDPDSDSRTRTEASRHWRYLFNRVGDLVAVRDPRGCGQDFFYDRAGRLVAEDYIACGEAQQGGETSVGTVSGVIGLELGASRAVDVLNTYDAMPAWVPTLSPAPPTTHLAGRPTGSIDRAQRTAVAYDVRGNAVWTARQLALIPADPSIPSTLSGDAPAVVVADAAPPVAPSYDTVRTYVMTDSFDAAGRPYRRDYPRDPDWTLFRPVGDTTPSPAISGRITYNQRGLPTATGIYFGNTLQRTVLASASYDAYGAPTTMRLRSATVDQALTQTFEYDVRHRPHAVRTERGLSSGIGGAAGTLNAIRVPFHELYDWDRASNLVGITSLASAPGAFPAGRRQQRRSVDHDSLNRVAHVFTEYLQDDLTWAPTDVGSDYRAERSRTNQDGTTHRVADPMQSTPAPSVVPQPSSRVVDLMYEYDWLANMTSWEDDARAFHERSIGAIGNGADASATADLRPSALYLSSNVRTSGNDPLEPNQGWLDVDYGEGGNVVAVTVRAQCTDRAPSQCVDTPTDDPAAREAQLLAGCLCASEQHYQYRWDELNRLAEARRYDRTGGTGSWSLAARLRYRYDAANTRLVKQSLDPQQTGTLRERTHLFVFPGDFERVGLRTNRTASPPRYVASTALGSETEYHVAGAHLVWKASANPGSFGRNRRLTMPIGDLLGTASAVVDLDSGHLVELATFHPNGAREMHWMTDEASLARERNAFTGKEEDEEVGVAYFGHRYLMPRLGRWASPDPLSVHAMGGGEAGNAYHYVGGNSLQAKDPNGLVKLEVSADEIRTEQGRLLREAGRKTAEDIRIEARDNYGVASRVVNTDNGAEIVLGSRREQIAARTNAESRLRAQLRASGMRDGQIRRAMRRWAVIRARVMRILSSSDTIELTTRDEDGGVLHGGSYQSGLHSGTIRMNPFTWHIRDGGGWLSPWTTNLQTTGLGRDFSPLQILIHESDHAYGCMSGASGAGESCASGFGPRLAREEHTVRDQDTYNEALIRAGRLNGRGSYLDEARLDERGRRRALLTRPDPSVPPSEVPYAHPESVLSGETFESVAAPW